MKEGPTHTINYKTQDFAQEVQKITEGNGVNVIVDFVGKSHWEKNISSLGFDGRMVILSTLSGEYQTTSSFYLIDEHLQVAKPLPIYDRYCTND